MCIDLKCKVFWIYEELFLFYFIFYYLFKYQVSYPRILLFCMSVLWALLHFLATARLPTVWELLDQSGFNRRCWWWWRRRVAVMVRQATVGLIWPLDRDSVIADWPDRLQSSCFLWFRQSTEEGLDRIFDWTILSFMHTYTEVISQLENNLDQCVILNQHGDVWWIWFTWRSSFGERCCWYDQRGTVGTVIWQCPSHRLSRESKPLSSPEAETDDSALLGQCKISHTVGLFCQHLTKSVSAGHPRQSACRQSHSSR